MTAQLAFLGLFYSTLHTDQPLAFSHMFDVFCMHTHIHTHVRLLDERLTDRNLNNDTARPNVSFKMQL